MCKIEKLVFLCKIEGKFAPTNVDALSIPKIGLRVVSSAFLSYIIYSIDYLHQIEK